jgi:hypothetical protein
MAASNNRRWLVIGFLLTFGLVLAAVWPRGASEGAGDSDTTDSDTSVAGESDAQPSALPAEQTDAGAKGRRIAPGCKPVEESLRYEEFVDKRALVILSWHDMPARTANLEIPVRVVGIEDGAIGVRFLEFPMREQYLNVWLGTEHIKPGPDGVFFVDPCSATVAEWSAMERGGAE